MVAAPEDDRFDLWDPANVSPVVAYLATADCPFSGGTFFVQGGSVRMFEPWRLGEGVEREGRWRVEDLAAAPHTSGGQFTRRSSVRAGARHRTQRPQPLR